VKVWLGPIGNGCQGIEDSGMASITRSFVAYEPDQLLLLPPSLRDWLPEGHLAYFIADVVGELKLDEIWQGYEGDGRAHAAYHPGMMVRVLLYAYCTGVFSSRRIERRLHEDVAFRVLAANNTPNFRTISAFRQRHLAALDRLFVQVLMLCMQAGMVKLGHVALDGSKIEANASKHKAMSYERLVAAQAKLEAEVAALLAQAAAVDAAEDALYGERRGDELPEELKFRQYRLAKIREARAALEAEAKARAAAEAASRQDQGVAAPEAAGKRRGGRKRKDTPKAKAQRNFTDPDSRIMKNKDKAYRQAYNAQAAVDSQSQVIVAKEVTNQASDAVHLPDMVEKIATNVGRLPQELSADAGYASEGNLIWLQEQKVEGFIAIGRMLHDDEVTSERLADPETTPHRAAMEDKLKTPQARSRYDLRKQTVEPVFGQIKGARGFRQFSFRGLEKVQQEWGLVCLGHNLLKLWRHRSIRPAVAAV